MRIRNAHRLSASILLMRVRTRLGLTVRPCDLQRILRSGDNAYVLLDKLVERRFARKTRTIDTGKGTLLYLLAEDGLRIGRVKQRPPRLALRWRVPVTFVPGWPMVLAYSQYQPGPNKVSLVRMKRSTSPKHEYHVVRYVGTLPGGWLVRLEDIPAPPPRWKRKRRRRKRITLLEGKP